ncbi:MAG TPA: hypothetical protein PKM88_00390 [bacterium]|nr:hypothetical protein [bacterium]
MAGALQVRGIDAAQMIDHPGFLASGAIWLLLPVVIGALFVIYNRRKVIHVLLVFFLLGNFAGWSLACLILSDGKGYDKPLAWFFWPMLDYLVLTAIFFLWVAINAWEMIREG